MISVSTSAISVFVQLLLVIAFGAQNGLISLKTFSLRFQSIDNGRLNHIWNTLLRPRLLCDVFSLDIVPVNTMPDQDPEIEFYRVATFPELDVDP